MGFRQLEIWAARTGPKPIAVVGAHDSNALEAVDRAAQKGIAHGILIGDPQRIEEKASDLGMDLSRHELVDATDSLEAARLAMGFVQNRDVAALMKGKITTSDLMQVLLSRGIRKEEGLLSHIAGFEHPRMGKDRFVILTDAGLIPYPTLAQRIKIIKNAVNAARRLGIEEPKTALLSLTEDVSDQIPASLDAAKLVELNGPGGALDGFGRIEGPMDLFCALDAEIAKRKGVKGSVVGKADILHVPDVVSGNMMSKGIIYFAVDARTGGAVVGGKVPIILLSRASSAEDKYCSLLLGVSCVEK